MGILKNKIIIIFFILISLCGCGDTTNLKKLPKGTIIVRIFTGETFYPKKKHYHANAAEWIEKRDTENGTEYLVKNTFFILPQQAFVWLNKKASFKIGSLDNPVFVLVWDDSEIKEINPKQIQVLLSNGGIFSAVVTKENDKFYFCKLERRDSDNDIGWVYKSPPKEFYGKCNQVYPCKFEAK